MQHTPSPRGLGSPLSGRVNLSLQLHIERERVLLTVIALDVPKEEARFLTKLDLTLISASGLGVMCRYLHQSQHYQLFQ
jgi:hypothetical protein